MRVDTGSAGQRAADQLAARAFAIGSHISFASGASGSSGTADDGRLLAHELAHVIQNRNGPPASGQAVSKPADAAEQEAEAVGRAWASGAPAPLLQGRRHHRRGRRGATAMTRVERTPCWVVLAPLPAAQLEEVVHEQWRLQVPYAIDPPAWFVEPVGAYSAVISPEPGTEGAERPLAARCSVLASGSPVYSLLLDPEREQIATWVAGKLVDETDRDPGPLAASLGLELPRPAAPVPPPSVAVVVGASESQVRQVLTDLGDLDWIRLAANRRGVLVSAASGPLGTQAWDIAEALPAAQVYYVQRDPATEGLSVLVLRDGHEAGSFLAPPLDDDTPRLPDILGASSPSAILDALDIPATAL